MEKKTERNSVKKAIVGGAAAIMATTAMFGGIIQSVKANELSKTSTIQTDYSFAQSPIGSQTAANAGTENFLVDYKVELEKISPKPDSTAVSMESAAATGVKDLKRLFGVNSKDVVVSMYYSPIGETTPRAGWDGSFQADADTTYFFSVDAVTGEITATCRDIKVTNANVGFDTALMKDSSQYEKLTRDVIAKYHLMPAGIASVEYVSQGYANGNPDIQLLATDVNGQRLQVSFSRYDQKLMQVCYENWLKVGDLLGEMIEKEFNASQQGSENITENNPSLITY